ncbi:MAG: transporter substrate-binding domain-containing protein [Alphaproteobacteria bacterium]|nr:transporter substrate-binding domain-containing protein [Alphaproteobacteria bacterium]
MTKILSTVVLSLLAGLAGAWLYASTAAPMPSSSEAQNETAFDRVMRTGVIRCGYASAPPLLMKDPNTGVLSGIGYEVMEVMGKALSLKIDWAEEMGWALFPTALKSGRIDAFCVGAWPSAARAREVDQTGPLSYQPYYAYVRPDDARFDNKIEAANDPSISISTMDGDTSQIISRSDFPKAKLLSLVETANPDEMLINVATGKADIAFIEPSFATRFNAQNPGKIRQVVLSQPLRVYGNVFFIAQGENRLRQMLNTALTEQLSSGTVERIIQKFEPVPNAILRVAPPYATPSSSR